MSLPHRIDERVQVSLLSLSANQDGRTDWLVGHDRHERRYPFPYRMASCHYSTGKGGRSRLHAISTPQSRILRRHRVGPGHLSEKGFHFPGRKKRDQNPPPPLSDKGPDMGNPAGRQQRLPWVELEPFCSHLEEKLPFEDVKPFLLLVMQVTGRATFGQEGVFQNTDIGCRRRGHLEGNGANAQAALFAKTIRTSGQKHHLWRVSLSR